MAEQINTLPYKANLEVYSETLQRLAETDRNIIAVTSDSRGSGKLVPFGKKYPDQIIEVGIAEQNLVGVAAGLASCGKKVFATSPACFLTARALEQIKNDVAYSNNPVNVIGISAGVSYGALGSTHHSLHDFAALRAINNITVVAPADNWETAQAIELAANIDEPVYLRFGKKPMPLLKENNNEKFEFGKGRVIAEGNDVLIIGCGETVYPALEAVQILKEKGIAATVVSMHTIKPLDTALLARLASTCKAIVTVEEHSIYGGLGEACASYLLQHGICKPFKIVGIPDEYTVTGSQGEIFDHYGINKEGISKVVEALLK
ncbi:transketolase family protein [Niabella ginsengisoli]|uniref:Transketolase family protein n=1 Tax=Niabella ginsengisoli TaxID=522298 RepID=A0ABS9SI10_9BACT|nr:transketolase C-terminal domain-containing protein [Niabella ginsengisoli]MCH5597799.1 transketolase family protein [Niabella ginsengisoli]